MNVFVLSKLRKRALKPAATAVVNPGGATSPSQAISVISDNVGAVQSVTAGHGQNASVSTAPTQAGQAGIAAAVQNAGSADRVTLTAATFTSNPASGTIFDAGGGITDLRLVGGDASDTVTAHFYYPSTVTGEAEAALDLLYYTGSVWAEALSSGGVAPIKTTTDDLDGTVSGGRFTVVFDSTSTPAVTDLAGTVFIATFEGPRVAIEVVLADVTQLRVAVTDKQDARKLDQAIQALTAALQPRAWLDDSHLQLDF